MEINIVSYKQPVEILSVTSSHCEYLKQQAGNGNIQSDKQPMEIFKAASSQCEYKATSSQRKYSK